MYPRKREEQGKFKKFYLRLVKWVTMMLLKVSFFALAYFFFYMLYFSIVDFQWIRVCMGAVCIVTFIYLNKSLQ